MLLRNFIKTGTLATVFLLMLSNIALANPLAARAASALTNRIMGMLEPKIAEMVDYITTPEDVFAHIEAALEENDPKFLLKVIEYVAQSKGYAELKSVAKSHSQTKHPQ